MHRQTKFSYGALMLMFSQPSSLALLPNTFRRCDWAAMPHPSARQLACTSVYCVCVVLGTRGERLGRVVCESPHDVCGMAGTIVFFYLNRVQILRTLCMQDPSWLQVDQHHLGL